MAASVQSWNTKRHFCDDGDAADLMTPQGLARNEIFVIFPGPDMTITRSRYGHTTSLRHDWLELHDRDAADLMTPQGFVGENCGRP